MNDILLATPQRDFSQPQFGMFVVDVILMVILIGLTLLSGRRWLMVASACHLLTLGDHFAMMMDRRRESVPGLEEQRTFPE